MSSKRIGLIISILIVSINSSLFAEWKENADAIKISGGENHTLVLTKNKWLWACGDNSTYQLGIGDTRDNQFSLVRVHDGDMVTTSNFLEDINDFDAGFIHSLALDVNSFVWAWGDNRFGQLGDNQASGPESTTPVQVLSGDQDPGNPDSLLKYIVAIAAGRSGAHSLAVDANSFVWAWGLNDTGQLGNGGEGTQKLTPVQVVGGQMGSTWLEDITTISGGEDNSIALDANGLVWTWGLNNFGQLGSGSTGGFSDEPVQVKSGQQDPCSPDTFLQNIIAIDSGWDHLLALDANGLVYAWGRNSKNNLGYTDYGGQLGDGTENDSDTPVKVLSGAQDPENPDTFLKDIIAVSAGDSHSMALDINGNVWTWGDNGYGQFGIAGSDPCSLTPVKVLGQDGVGYLENIVSISAGYWHCLAIDAEATLWTWGKHSVGSLGLGAAIGQDDSNTPHRIGVVYNLTQQSFHFSIQHVIDDAETTGDTLQASPATYFEDIDFLTKTINLSSLDPNNWDTVAETIIQGSGSRGVPAVKFENNPDSVLKGFTITNDDYGIECDASSPDISNCVIRDCGGHGLYCRSGSSVEVENTKILNNGTTYSEDGISCSNSFEITLSNCLVRTSANRGIICWSSDLTVRNCTIEDNDTDGIYSTGSSSSLITNNIIRGNTNHGVYCQEITGEMVIRNNWIYGNGDDGIYLYNYGNPPESPSTVRHNTIVSNDRYGINSYYAVDANVTNCIIWGNDSPQLYSTSGTLVAAYSCIEGGYPGTGNISSDPCFADAGEDDYHLDPNSACIDAGDPSFAAEPNETDIDGEPRIIDGDGNDTSVVDMGADEYYISPADFNGDKIVNLLDYAILANTWQRSAGQAGYNDTCDLQDNDIIDANDLGLFGNDWLWYPGWTRPAEMMMAGSGGGQLYSAEPASEIHTQSEQAITEEAAGEELTIKQAIEWLDLQWQTDQKLREMVTESEWQEFIEVLKNHLE